MFHIAENVKISPKKSAMKQTTPRLVRKKSGEIVKPALKPNLVRNNSVPTKFVHFDSQLEYVKLFMKSERPESISNPPSDDDGSDSDEYSELSSDNEDDMQLSIRLPNFTPSIFSTHNKPVMVEKVYLSQDKSTLLGNVMVHNLAFHKKITLRYTFDFWQSVQEVELNFKETAINPSESFPGVDKFQFTVDLKDKVSLKLGAPKKNMFFAIRYQVNEQELWDNNEGVNYQVEFVVSKPQTHRYPLATLENYSSKSISTEKPAPLKSAFSGKLGSRYSFGVSLGSMFTAEPEAVKDKVEQKSKSSYFFSSSKKMTSYNFAHQKFPQSWENQTATTDFDYSPYSPPSQSSLSSSPIYGSSEFYSYSSPYSMSSTATCIRG
ncbi:hypothetical protein K7432_004025 [Basidiobolus ranarum]|uniref:CBM21 domain-containing protein n=1 Tax=Basidiobolus ranarum TaxID=34480 RepID=A0ABR2W599_9FUNG